MEDSPSGLWRTLGKRVGVTASRVRISYPAIRLSEFFLKAFFHADSGGFPTKISFLQPFNHQRIAA